MEKFGSNMFGFGLANSYKFDCRRIESLRVEQFELLPSELLRKWAPTGEGDSLGLPARSEEGPFKIVGACSTLAGLAASSSASTRAHLFTSRCEVISVKSSFRAIDSMCTLAWPHFPVIWSL